MRYVNEGVKKSGGCRAKIDPGEGNQAGEAYDCFVSSRRVSRPQQKERIQVESLGFAKMRRWV